MVLFVACIVESFFMYRAGILGASGYTGVELANYLVKHPHFELAHCLVSEQSVDAHKLLSELYPSSHAQDHCLIPASLEDTLRYCQELDVLFLATPHEVSHDWAAELMQTSCKLIDLSGAFRLTNPSIFANSYGFEHQHSELQRASIYALVDWLSPEQKAAITKTQLISVPGCYPTASLLALKPLVESGLLDKTQTPIINAVSGVSGAGRKASLTSHFCEVSLSAYGVLAHRHQPEIEEHGGVEVVFTPHLGNFKRGILATVTARLEAPLTQDEAVALFHKYYQGSELVRVVCAQPKIDQVVGTVQCHLCVTTDSRGMIVVTSVIDNLLKGASGQALQAANLAFGLAQNLGVQ